MKLLVVNDLLQGGGVEKLMYDIVMKFHKQYEITVLTDKKDPAFSEIYPADVGYLYQMEQDYPMGRNRIERKLISKKRAGVERKLKSRIEGMKFDVLLCMKESWIMMMAMNYGSSIPKRIAWVHTDYAKSYYTKAWFGSQAAEVRYMQRFHHVICVSQVILDSIKKVIGDPGNLLLRYNPVDQNEILRKAQEPVEDIKRSERMLFVTVGRLNYQKGYDILMEVCNLLNAEGFEYDVWIIGGGESWNHYEVLHDLEDRRFRYGLDNVYLLGKKENPYKYMKQADWFLSTSRFEGYSYVSQEAAILKKPLLLTECAGVSELLADISNGIMVENSYKGIYCGMKNCIQHPEETEQYSSRVRACNPENYGEKRFREIEKLFSE